MLEIYRYGETVKTPCALVLGGFDGLHAGHRALLELARETNLPVGITTMLGGKDGTIFSKEEREHIFEKAGIDFVYEIMFTEELKSTSAEDFLTEIFAHIPAKIVICGEDFRFGNGAAGTPALLEQHAPCPVKFVKIVEWGGKKLSTSECKRFLQEGNFEMLGAQLEYFMQGAVEHGRKVGRTMGFPTVNIAVSAEKLLPADGVYGGRVETPGGTYKAIINIGARPTFGVEERKIEAHLIEFSGDLYGATVRIFPTRFLRPILQFSSVEALKQQLEKDKKAL